MAVGKKGLRKVKFKGKTYFWQVKKTAVHVPEQGFVQQAANAWFLHIISADKQFIVRYRIPEVQDAQAHLRVEGRLFPRAPGQKEVNVPRWRHDSKRYPTADFVRRLVEWCMDPD